MKYDIVRCVPEHEAAAIELERILWQGDTAENVAHLRWKYREGPLSEHSHLFVALHGNRVVGVRGLVGGRWQLAGSAAQSSRADDVEHAGGAGAARSKPAATELVALSAADLVIAPDHRNTGLYRQLTEHALSETARSGYPVAFNFSAGSVNRMASLAAGWREAFTVPERVRRAHRSLIARIGGALGAPLDAWRALTTRPTGRDTETRAGKVSIQEAPSPGDLADLVARAPWGGELRQRRDEPFFRWRFAGPKACNRFVTCHGAGRLRGYAVLQARTHRPGHITIVDHEAETSDVLEAMLSAALEWAGDLKIVLWSDAVGLRGGEPMLERLGFARAESAGGVRSEGPRVLLRPLDAAALAAIERETGRELRHGTDWDLRPAYSDAF